jgi:RNA polymerase primary sigma factor
MMGEFILPGLRNLSLQLGRFAPPSKRREQLQRAGRLVKEISQDRSYPFTYVVWRITEHRTDEYGTEVVPGCDLIHDLNLFIEQIQTSMPALPIERAKEPMLTLEEISKRFNVSTRTISRWRVRGLVGQRIIISGRMQLGFPTSVVERFAETQRERVERSARFSHLTEEEKQSILRMAQRLSQEGGILMDVCRQIAKDLNRSVEAIRYTVRAHDQANPELAIFPDLVGPLDRDIKDSIQEYDRRGTPVTTVSKQYASKSKSLADRLISQVRAEQVKQPPLDYIANESFDDEANDAAYLADMPAEAEFEAERAKMHAPKDVPADLASLYEWPLLNREQEAHLFRQMNYLKHKIRKTQSDAGEKNVDKQVAALTQRVKDVRDRLINCNMRLVVKHAKQHASAVENLFELISDGNISLMRAVEKFDYSRGNKFSTYASWAIIKNFARSIPDEKTHRERYITGNEELFDIRADVRTDEQERMLHAEMAKDYVSILLADLDPRTRDVIRMRNGLDGSEEMTLEQIGQLFGITKERVRQINVRGMKILRERAAQEKVQLP